MRAFFLRRIYRGSGRPSYGVLSLMFLCVLMLAFGLGQVPPTVPWLGRYRKSLGR